MVKYSSQFKALALVCTLIVQIGVAGCSWFSVQDEEASSTSSSEIDPIVLSSETVSAIGESAVDPTQSNDAVVFQTVDPMELVDYENSYTIEIGRFVSELEAQFASAESGLDQDEMGIACQSQEAEHYYLLGYGLYLDYEQARKILIGLQQKLPDALEYLQIRRLAEVEALSAQFHCLSAQSS